MIFKILNLEASCRLICFERCGGRGPPEAGLLEVGLKGKKWGKLTICLSIDITILLMPFQW
jgi:hypothetical protein